MNFIFMEKSCFCLVDIWNLSSFFSHRKTRNKSSAITNRQNQHLNRSYNRLKCLSHDWYNQTQQKAQSSVLFRWKSRFSPNFMLRVLVKKDPFLLKIIFLCFSLSPSCARLWEHSESLTQNCSLLLTVLHWNLKIALFFIRARILKPFQDLELQFYKD